MRRILSPLSPSPSLSSPVLFSSLLISLWNECGFSVLGTVLILHSRKWENTIGQGVLWEWVTIFPSGFICLLYKSPCCPQKCQLLINGTANYHIFTLEMQSKLSQPCSTALKNETVTTCCKVLKEFSRRHCLRLASTWLTESFEGKICILIKWSPTRKLQFCNCLPQES